MNNYSFKVFDPINNLYAASGGTWTKKGKVWGHISHLRSAFKYKKIEPFWIIVVLKEVQTKLLCSAVCNGKMKQEEVLDFINQNENY